MVTRSVNKVTLLGYLGKDAETKFTPNGIAVSKFSVATSRRWKSQDADEWKEETDWHNVVLWRQESLANYLTKGTKVYLEGRLQTRTYDDKDGVKRYITEIVAEEVILLGNGQQDGSRQSQSPDKSGNNERLVSQPRGRAAAAPAPPPPTDDFGNQGITDDDVPF